MATGLTFYGMDRVVGAAVSVWCAGLDCGDYTVQTDGSIFVPYGADPSALFTPAYLKTISDAAPTGGWDYPCRLDVTINGSTVRVVVPCVIGYTYTSQGQLLRPELEADQKLPGGPGFGNFHRHQKYAAKFVNTISGSLSLANTGTTATGVSIGTNFSNLYPVIFRTANGNTPADYVTLQTGVLYGELDDSSGTDGLICWQITRPYPCTIAAVNGFLDTEAQ